MTTTAPAATRTPAEWEALAVAFEQEARGHRTEAADSFDRCDTDGFVSQWASGANARLMQAKAAWARDHGKVEVSVLLDAATGRIVSTHSGEGDYGPYWVLDDQAAAAFGKRFFSPSSARSYAKRRASNLKRGGFVIARAKVDGTIQLQGSGTGLAGALTVSPWPQPSVEALKARDVEIVDRDWLQTLADRHGDDA